MSIEHKSSKQHRLPEFIVVGAAKSGTTSLYFYLRQHPKVFMPAGTKEPGFFCFHGITRPVLPSDHPYPNLWSGVVLEELEYFSLFEDATADQIVGEASPEYLYLYEPTIQNIKRYYASSGRAPKIIIILRNPIDRIWSHYWMTRRDGYETLPFEQATDPRVIADRLGNGWHPSYDYRGYGFYANAIKAFQQAFGKDRILVILFDELVSNASQACSTLFQFLGADPNFKSDVSTVYNASGQLRYPALHEWLFLKQHVVKSVARKVVPFDLLQWMKHRILAWNTEKLAMPTDIRQQLVELYRHDIAAVAALIDRDLAYWTDVGRVSTSTNADVATLGQRAPAEQGSIASGLISRSVNQMPFEVFKLAYKVLARTPLRRVPGMLTLSNLLFRWVWKGGNVINVQGNKMYIDVFDPTSALRKTFQAYAMNLVHEEATTRLFQRVIRPGNVVLDLGANIGYFSLIAARRVGPMGRVVSFEPEPRNVYYFGKNVEVNGFENIISLHQKAVANYNGQADLYICTYDSGHHTINTFEGIAATSRGRRFVEETIKVEVVRIDDFLREAGIDHVDVIKIDVEGAEVIAFEGMQRLLQRDDNVKIFLEYFPMLIEKMGNDPRKYIESLMFDFGFHVYVIAHDYDADSTRGDLIEVKSYEELSVMLSEKGDHANLFLSKGAA